MSISICDELMDKAWASTRWSKGKRPVDHVCARASKLLASLDADFERIVLASTEDDVRNIAKSALLLIRKQSA